MPKVIYAPGFIAISIAVPSIYENMCGFFYDIKTSAYSGIYYDKIWVVLDAKKLYCYSDQFSTELLSVDNNYFYIESFHSFIVMLF